MYSFKGKNPTELYYEALQRLINEGDEVSPRGKLVKELRPASVEFENPFNRVTFLGSRKINPFFQVFESLWILSGRADVKSLSAFNANMKQFSDDGVWFNAPYGERLRSWNKNSAHGIIINPIDQMIDAYRKILNDKDTRQAVMVISNPMFDNSRYTIDESGRDIACNLVITFKVRHDKLNMTVFNRSNDAHWGLWGANLCQFSTIQEVMMNWLKHSGKPEFEALEIGTYTQLTDSLHIYMDDYGAKCTQDVVEYYTKNDPDEVKLDIEFKSEPRMSQSQEKFDDFVVTFWQGIAPYLLNDDFLKSKNNVESLLSMVSELHSSGTIDDYWLFGIKSMISYRLRKLGYLLEAVQLLGTLEACQWKMSMLYMLKGAVKKTAQEDVSDDWDEMKKIYEESTDDLVNNLVDPSSEEFVRKYLSL